MADSLTEKQLRFCREYAANPNATQAYLRAYGMNLSYFAASDSAQKLLENPLVKSEISAARQEYMRAVKLSAVRILRGMMEIAFVDQDDLFEPDPCNNNMPKPRSWDSIRPATRRAMQSVKIKRRKLKSATDETWEVEEVEYKFPDKNAAFDKLCKHLGLTKEDMKAAAEELVKIVRLPQEFVDALADTPHVAE